jgi:acetyl-coA C-acetyltransferase
MRGNLMQDIYIIAAKRTPFGRYRGQLAAFNAVELGTYALKDALKAANLRSSDLDALFMGNVLSAGLGQNMARQVAINSGMREESVATTINEVCGSSLKAVRLAQAQMLIGDLDLVAVGGSESMTNAPLLAKKSEKDNPNFVDSMLNDGLTDSFSNKLMGNTCENVAVKYGISRAEADEFSVNSHQKAARAQAAGFFNQEITPLAELDHDENVRPDSNVEKLASLKTVFKEGGVATAGNSSPLSDGASMLILATEDKVKELNLKPLAKLTAYAEVGLDPQIMGFGPKVVIEKLLQENGQTLADIDLFEINEAFAATSLAVEKELHLDHSKVNIHGGALALGHPLGASGARILGTLAHSLISENKERGIASLCIGGGLAIAFEIERGK